MESSQISREESWKKLTGAIDEVATETIRKTFESEAERNPLDTEAAGLAGLALLQQGRFVDAIPLLERGCAVSAWAGLVSSRLALAYTGAGRYEDAEKLICTLVGSTLSGDRITITGANYELAGALGTCVLHAGKHRHAMNLFRAVIDFVSAILKSSESGGKAATYEEVPQPPPRKVYPIVYLPVEIAARELTSKLLIAAFAASRGLAVVVAASSVLSLQGYKELPPGILLTKTLNFLDRQLMRKAVAAGHVVAALDEEAFGRASNEVTYRSNVHPHCVALADAILLQGEEQQAILQRLYPAAASKLHLTGNPKVDLFDARFQSIAALPDIESHAGCILICLMSGNINANGQPFANAMIKTLRLSGHLISSPAGRDFTNTLHKCVAFEAAMVPKMRAIVSEVAARFPDRSIVVRPHPTETPTFWSSYFTDLPNVTIRADHALPEWLKATSAVVYIGGSASGLECYLSGVRAIQIAASGDAVDPGTGFSSRINRAVRTPTEVVAALTSVIAGEEDTAIRQRDSEIVAKFLYRPRAHWVSAEVANVLADLQTSRDMGADTPLDQLVGYNRRRETPFVHQPFYLRKFPETSAKEIATRIESLASEAGLPDKFQVDLIDYNSFLIRRKS